jgi:hypothetical protein
MLCTGSATQANLAWGFYGCSSSTFNTCNGEAYLTALSGCRKACGFYNNTSSSFLDCTTTAKICVDCADCTFTCDV